MPKPTPTGRPCRKCGAADPPRYADGRCTPCTLANNTAWRRRHPEQVAALKAEWNRANPDKRAASRLRSSEANKLRARRWYRANTERGKDYTAAWRAANPGQAKAAVAAWRIANPDLVIAQAAACRKRRRARLAGAVCEPYDDPDIFERDGWLCQLCDQPIDPSLSRMNPMGATIDHIVPVSKGGDDTPENAGTAHRRCNTVRHNRSIEWARARLIPAL